MGDSRRFDLFASLVERNFPPSKYPSVADIAGGQGYLQLALRQRRYRHVTTFDKRRYDRRLPNLDYQYRYFNNNVLTSFSLIVGMHPDEATDVIVTEAIKRKIPFVVCPCCVMPTAIPFWGIYKYPFWLQHLKRIAERGGYKVVETQLRMNGKNIVLIGRPNV